MTTPPAPFGHLLRMSDETGLFEHAKLTAPRRECGYCVDDVARGLVVTSRQPAPDAAVAGLAERYLRFVVDAQVPDGRVHNRLGLDRRWHDEPGLEDCWGRALWGLGTAAARRPGAAAGRALAAFEVSASRRSPSPRAMAFAALGAAEVLGRHPDHAGARGLLAAAAATVGRPRPGGWPWPEPRLGYANAALAEVLLAAGRCLDDDRMLADGLLLLDWLLGVETAGDHLSLTPVGGWGPGERRPGFDQQPIEAWAMVDACRAAAAADPSGPWMSHLEEAAGWFLGRNDVGVVLYDDETGAGFDGLTAEGVNFNRGAESTLAALGSMWSLHDAVLRRGR